MLGEARLACRHRQQLTWAGAHRAWLWLAGLRAGRRGALVGTRSESAHRPTGGHPPLRPRLRLRGRAGTARQLRLPQLQLWPRCAATGPGWGFSRRSWGGKRVATSRPRIEISNWLGAPRYCPGIAWASPRACLRLARDPPARRSLAAQGPGAALLRAGVRLKSPRLSCCCPSVYPCAWGRRRAGSRTRRGEAQSVALLPRSPQGCTPGSCAAPGVPPRRRRVPAR